MQLITSLATLAAAISSVNALGSAIINNNCDFDVYMWAVDAQRNPTSASVISSKGSYSEAYHTPSSGGVSLKLSKTNQKSKITQFEYTVESYLSTAFIWYDGSNVDCTGSDCPFYMNGINLKTTDPSCPTRDCAVGQVCSGFYTLYNDDVNSLSCGDDKDVIMTLCSVNTAMDGSSGSGSSSGSSPIQKAAAAPTTTSAKAAVMNEAVATTFVTAYTAAPAKRNAEPVHHNHMRIHQRAAVQEAS